MKRFAFVMDPLEKLDLPWDTSLSLLRELSRRGHETFLFTAESLSLGARHVKGEGGLVRPWGRNRYRQGSLKKLDLARFHAVFIRKDPPFDSSYLSLTYLLEPLAEQVPVVNQPRGIRNANEKLFGLSWPALSPPTLVTASPLSILSFQEELGTDLVLKPLYDKGGKGVFLLPQKSARRLVLLKRATRDGREALVAQKFIQVPPGQGDKRILLWKGEALGAFARIPRKGEFRSNLSLGGRFTRCEVSEAEKKIIRTLRPFLLREGLFFVGLDVRAEKLLEVNVTSPAGLVELDRLYGGGITEKLADALERLAR